MAASLGEQLRLAREARGISLREISEQTRISIRYLEAIETDDYKRLPGGIFNRSFVKAYARYVGFDEKEAVEGYVRTAREQGESPDDVSTTPYRSHVYTNGGGTRSPLVTLLLTILILGILVLGVYAGRHWWQRRQSERAQTPATPAAPAQAPNQNVAQRGQAPMNAATFNIQIKAKSKVWVRIKADDGDSTEKILDAEETRDFTPVQRLSIQLSKANVDSLEIIINGRMAKIPAETRSNNLAEIVITRNDYERYLQ